MNILLKRENLNGFLWSEMVPFERGRVNQIRGAFV